MIEQISLKSDYVIKI